VTLDELELAIHLVKENDILSPDSRSHQKLLHGIKVVMAKNYIDNLSEEIKKGMQEKAEQGLYPSFAPIGYVNAVANGKKFIQLDSNWLHRFRNFSNGTPPADIPFSNSPERAIPKAYSPAEMEKQSPAAPSRKS
jgi:DNA invertase Pin-like site-specific DNA recombinase